MRNNPPRYPRPAARHQRGTSLIEILVSILILTLGVLALAGLHASALRYSKMAELRTTASQLAEDYADRMRANRQGVTTGQYTWQRTDASAMTVPPITCTNACSSAQIAAQVAANDKAQWFNVARAVLPGVGIYASPPTGATGSDVMDVFVVWTGPQGNSADSSNEANMISAAEDCPVENVTCVRFRFTL